MTLLPGWDILSKYKANKPFLPQVAFVKCMVTILRKVANTVSKRNWVQIRREIYPFVSLIFSEIYSPHRQSYISLCSHLHSSLRNSFKVCFRRMNALLLNTASSKDIILHLYCQTQPEGGFLGWEGTLHSKTFFQHPQKDPSGLMLGI